MEASAAYRYCRMDVLRLCVVLCLCFADAARVEESGEACTAGVKEELTHVLVGKWDTDYRGGFFLDTSVTIRSLDPSKLRFMRSGLELADHFEAESARFADEGVGNTRLLTVTQLFPLTGKPGDVIAEIAQRIDSASGVRHIGELFLEESTEGLRWVIEWEHADLFGKRRRWWRLSDEDKAAGGSSQPDAADTRERGRLIAAKVSKSWGEECEQQLGEPIWEKPDYSITLNVGAGIRYGLVGSQLTYDLNYDQDMVVAHREYLQCWLGKASTYINTAAKTNHTAGAALAKSLSDVMSLFANLADLSSRDELCRPAFVFSFGFTIVPFPPFLWPVPSLSASFGFDLKPRMIKECMTKALSGDIFEEATTARPNFGAASALAGQVAEKMESTDVDPDNEASVSFTPQPCQGPSFAFLPPAVGWYWAADVAFVINLRKLVTDVHRYRWQDDGGFAESDCERDREDALRQVARWGKLADQLHRDSSTACNQVRKDLDMVSFHHPEASLQRPLGLVPHVAQLGDSQFNLNETRSVDLGGGTVYIGTDGVALGITQYLGSTRRQAYKNQCKLFADFVNFYHTRVLPFLVDVRTDGDCPLEVARLPSLAPGSCSIGASALPLYPEVVIDGSFRVLADSSSVCTQCMSQHSLGMPCRFCADARGNGICSQFFESPPLRCLRTAEVPLLSMDRPGSSGADPRLWCAAQGGSLRVRNSAGDETAMELLPADLFKSLRSRGL